MNNSETGYCRLCGELKNSDDFINLLEDSGAREEITRKLQRVNAFVDFASEVLPMTVCFVCITELHRAFDFVFNVERAQASLCHILLKTPIKEEVEDPIDTDTGDQNVVTPSQQSSMKVENKTAANVKPLTFIVLLKKPPESSLAGTSQTANRISAGTENVAASTKTISAPPQDISALTKYKSASTINITASTDSTLFFEKPPDSTLDGTSKAKASPLLYIPALSNNISSLMKSTLASTDDTPLLKKLLISSESLTKKSQTEARPLLYIPSFKNNESSLTKSTLASIDNEIECSFPPRPEVTWSTYSWECSYCGTEFATIKELNSHSMQFHETCNAYRCSDCKMRKSSLKHFLKHVKMHREHLKYSCHLCFKTFLSSGEAHRHNFDEHLKMKTENFCEGCHSLFENKVELEIHTESYFKSVKRCLYMPLLDQTKGLTCLICNKTFKAKPNLHNHLMTHTDRKRNHTCETCGKCFFTKRALYDHVKSVHDDARPFQCEICKATFKRHQKLRDHIGTHSTSKPFECKDCGRCFRQMKLLTSHSVIHSDSAPHVCEHCNKAFKTKSLLTVHLRQHTGVRPYSCVECSKGFAHWGNYNKHMKGIHGVDTAKRKHTSEGSFLIDPKTGEPMIPPKTEQLMEWQRQVMQPKQRKRKACSTDSSNAADPQNNESVTQPTPNEEQINSVKICDTDEKF